MGAKSVQQKPGRNRASGELSRLRREVEQQARELSEARQHQVVTAEVLKAISSSNFDLQAVLNTLVESATRMCGAKYGQIFKWDGAHMRWAAGYALSPEFLKTQEKLVYEPGQGSLVARTALNRQVTVIEDVLADPEYAYKEDAKIGGIRTILGVPLLRSGDLIGVLALDHERVRGFTETQIELATSFADQAVIAIENARLFEEAQTRNRELSEALEQQTATGTILRAIAASPTDVQPVLDTVIKSAARLCGADFGQIFTSDGTELRWAVGYGMTPEFLEIQRARVYRPGPESLVARTALNMRITIIDDALEDPDYAFKEQAKVGNYRTMLGVPLMRSGSLIGVLALVHHRVEPFTAKQISMVTTFADQAVIAIENTRVFAELQTRNRELTEALEQQTATGTILRAIAASPTDVGPVLNTVVESAARLCQAHDVVILLEEKGKLVARSHYGPIALNFAERPIGRDWVTGRAVVDRKPIHVHDVLKEKDEFPSGYAMAEKGGGRTILAVPLLREDKAIGVIAMRRLEVEPFSQKQIDLLVLFADQAAIAIENTRLFQELEARNRELTEALEQQTATGMILRAIADSPTDVTPVLNAVAESAAKLCGAFHAQIFRWDGTYLRWAAGYGLSPEFLESQRQRVYRPGKGSLVGRTALNMSVTVIEDMYNDPDYDNKEDAKASDTRTILGVPLMRSGDLIGVLALPRQRVEPFTDRQIKLVTTFADQAVIAIENIRLFEELKARNRELTEALEQQTATGTILRAIAASPTNVQPVLNAVAQSAAKLCDAYDSAILLEEGGALVLHAHHGSIPIDITQWPITRDWVTACAYIDRRPVHVHDVMQAESTYPSTYNIAKRLGFRTILAVPMLREDKAIGALLIRRPEVRPFSQKQIDLLVLFADQAAIAIQNTRLFEEVQTRNRELIEALEQQTATGTILRAIAASPTDVKPVLNAVAQSAARLCEAYDAAIMLAEGDILVLHAHHGPIPIDITSWSISRDWVTGRAYIDHKPVHVHDLMAEGEEYPAGQAMAERLGFRTILAVPMLRENKAIGVLYIRRHESRPFSQKQIDLLVLFADQAAIAIENSRLFEELQKRNRELTEALEQQTATGTILRVIATSPADVQPVLNTVAESAAKLCEAYDAVILLAEDGALVPRAHHGPIPVDIIRYPIGRDWVTGRAYIDRKPIHVHDLMAEREEYPAGQALAERLGHRSTLAVPLMRENNAIGAVVIRRREMRPFSKKQIELLLLFADQAAIAIENTRLFEELETRNRELTEALEQQTATGTILRAIAASPADVQPVLNTVAESAAKLCEAYDAVILLAEDGALVPRAHHGPIPLDFARWPIGRDWVTGRAYCDQKPVHVHDLMAERGEYPAGQAMAERLGHRTILAVPLMRESKAIGAVAIRRREVRPFSQKQIDLVVLFADQVAIAMENTRLFAEVQTRNRELTEAIERQTATAEVLKAISRATFDLPAVLGTLVASAARLCGATYGGIMLREGDKLRGRAVFGGTPEDEADIQGRLVPIDRTRISGRVVLSGQVEQIPDILADPEYDSFIKRVSNIRAQMGVPLLRQGIVEGVFFLGRPEPGAFKQHQCDLVQTFADQAVIATENVRLLEEVQSRTRELQETLNYQTAIGEVLNVISRSPSDVQPVLDVILQTAVRLCDADGGTIARERDRRIFRAGQGGFSPEFMELMAREPAKRTRGTVTGRTLIEGKVVHILDAGTDPEYTWDEARELGNLRTLLGVPLLRDKTVMGVIALIRCTVRPFTEKQIELVTTFADQAVIAIENARLFEEVQARTSELARSVEELRALGEVSRSVNSTLDLKTVLETIVTKAVQLSRTDAGAIYVYSRQADRFRLRATYGMSDELIAAIAGQTIRLGDPGIGDAARARQPTQTEDLAVNAPTPVHQIVLEAGFHSVLVVPLLRPNKVVGALVVRRRAPGHFSEATVRLMETFAAQSVLAIQNARLFSEVEEKGHQLEIASRHKSQFLANMSHELRTPLNSVLGFTEMLADGLYGELPEKARTTLGRVQANGRHLLGLINDVLDLSKIEAGQLTLSLDDYAIGQIVRTVAATTEPLARAKGLALTAVVAEGLPLGRGDERRIHQVLLNLAGNAVKFTERGSIEIAANLRDGNFEILVRDTGPGIALEHQTRIFEEFQQVDDSNTRQKGGTGLGLAISKRIVEMHGGSIGIESTPGVGSTFQVKIPVRAAEGKEAI